MQLNTSGVTTIRVKDNDITIRFGLPACQAYASMLTSEDSEKYFSGVDILALGMAKLLLAAYENQCLVKDSEPVLTLGAFMEFVEDTLTDNPKEAERIVKVFTDSRYTKVMVDRAKETIEDNKKKQSIGSLLNLTHSANSDLPSSSTMLVPSENLNSGGKGMKDGKRKSEKRKKK